jgi:hypothetical protein
MPAAPALPEASAGGNLPSVDDLIRLLAGHRQALLQRGPEAADEIEAGSRRLEKAFATLAASLSAPDGYPGRRAGSVAQASELARLQDELQATQATLSKLTAGNRRALDSLFGEASLYSR